MYEFNYKEVKEYVFYDLARPFMRGFFKPFYRIRVEGAEKVPDEGGFILASNHVSAADPIFFASNVKNRRIHFMAKKEVFKNIFAKWIITHYNAFPIERGNSDKTALEYAITLLEQGRVLGIFPEGTRSRDGTPRQPKAGVGLIAKSARADVLPAAICIEGKLHRGSEVVIRFGELIRFEEFSFSEEDKSHEFREAAEYIMGKIAALREESVCE